MKLAGGLGVVAVNAAVQAGTNFSKMSNNNSSGGSSSSSSGKVTENTGRTTPNNLNEQLGMKQVQADPLNGAKKLPIELKDSRWPTSEGWVKMQNNVSTSKGNVNVHFNYNTKTGAVADFKFK